MCTLSPQPWEGQTSVSPAAEAAAAALEAGGKRLAGWLAAQAGFDRHIGSRFGSAKISVNGHTPKPLPAIIHTSSDVITTISAQLRAGRPPPGRPTAPGAAAVTAPGAGAAASAAALAAFLASTKARQLACDAVETLGCHNEPFGLPPGYMSSAAAKQVGGSPGIPLPRPRSPPHPTPIPRRGGSAPIEPSYGWGAALPFTTKASPPELHTRGRPPPPHARPPPVGATIARSCTRACAVQALALRPLAELEDDAWAEVRDAAAALVVNVYSGSSKAPRHGWLKPTGQDQLGGGGGRMACETACGALQPTGRAATAGR